MDQKNRSRLVQILANLQKLQSLLMGVSNKLWSRIVAAKRRAEALPATQTDIPREHVMLKFMGGDAETNTGSSPGRNPVEAMKKDGDEREPGGEETPSKKQKVLFAAECCLTCEGEGVPIYIHQCQQDNPIQLLRYYLL